MLTVKDMRPVWNERDFDTKRELLKQVLSKCEQTRKIKSTIKKLCTCSKYDIDVIASKLVIYYEDLQKPRYVKRVVTSEFCPADIVTTFKDGKLVSYYAPNIPQKLLYKKLERFYPSKDANDMTYKFWKRKYKFAELEKSKEYL